tara:strand:+ start:136 stop:501 length:366 start_codon:yes stop_codon:yes gene_type:complete
MEYLKNYIIEWNKEEGVKPQNDTKFIAEFVEFAKNADPDQWEFDGENDYCGHTATVSEHPLYLHISGLGFEFAYGAGFVKVFTSAHCGYWTPEYIKLTGDNAKELLLIIKEKLNSWAGFKS